MNALPSSSAMTSLLGLAKCYRFMLRVFHVMGKALTEELSCRGQVVLSFEITGLIFSLSQRDAL